MLDATNGFFFLSKQKQKGNYDTIGETTFFLCNFRGIFWFIIEQFLSGFLVQVFLLKLTHYNLSTTSLKTFKLNSLHRSEVQPVQLLQLLLIITLIIIKENLFFFFYVFVYFYKYLADQHIMKQNNWVLFNFCLFFPFIREWF